MGSNVPEITEQCTVSVDCTLAAACEHGDEGRINYTIDVGY